MPELPEVETYKRYFASTALGQQIDNIKVKDDRILKVEENEFINTLQGNSFKSVTRHGKYLFIECNSIFLVMHFGMTGDLEYYHHNEEEPAYTKVLFEFTNNYILSYISTRMFGKLDITDNMREYIQKKRLGPDALTMSYEDFIKSLEKRTTNIKTALMNQSIVCGIGNIYSDEILFRSKINPLTRINVLEERQLRQLFSNIKDVLLYGIEKEGILSTYSDKFLIPHRNQEDECPLCKRKIERYEILGRHGFFCPNCQKLH
ncbi:MAG: DNA-formamidopyrimidine glycosylase [Promethearchaeota archaeon]|nr:MAG: DNA-formamidopyrimidine glycosylase [Candidatus Lokiarchaeota archaeon]